jgi:hypothetical protein
MTISGIFLLQHECKSSACAPLTFPSCTARERLSPTCCLVNVLSLNFLWKRETRQESSTSDFQRLNDKAWNDITLHCPKRRSQNSTRPADLWELSFGGVSDSYWSTLREKGKRSMQPATFRRPTNLVVRFVKSVRGRKLSSFNMTTLALTLHVWPYRQFKRTPGNSSPINPRVRIWAFRLPLVRVLENSPDRSPLRNWRCSPSRNRLIQQRQS